MAFLETARPTTTRFDVESVDWESEFKNPYLAKSSKDWVKEIVNKEFLDEYKKL